MKGLLILMKRMKLNFFKIIFSLFIFSISVLKINSELSTIRLSKVLQTISNESILKIFSLFLVGALGIFILCLYDFALIRKLKTMKISKIKLLKISWIANSFNAVLGFGGIFGASVRYNFYKNYIDQSRVNQLKKAISLLLISSISGVGVLSAMVLLNVFPESHLLEGNDTIKIGLIVSACLLPLYIGYISIKPPLPAARWLGLQFTIVSTIDYLTSGIVMYVAFRFLNLQVQFVDMESIFILATIAGIISMVPGGFGAFDVIFLLGATQELQIDKEAVLMALILYRLAYYFIPLLFGLLFSVSEVQMLISQKISNNQFTILTKEFTTVVFSITQAQMKQIGRTLSTAIFLFCSLTFLFDSCILFFEYAYMGMKSAFFIAPIYVCLSILLLTDVVGIYKGAIDTWEMLRFKLMLLALCQFYLFWEDQSLTALLLTTVLFVDTLFYRRWLEVEVIKQSVLEKLIWTLACLYVFDSLTEIFPILPRQSFFILSGTTLLLLLLSGLWSVIHRRRKRKSLKLDLKLLDDAEYRNFLEQNGGNHLAHLGFLKENRVAWWEDVAVIYQENNHYLFILGDPVGKQEAIFPFLKTLVSKANQLGKRIVFYQASTQYLSFYNDLNCEFFKLGEEAVIDLSEFSLSGKKKRGFRATLNQMEKLGYTFEIIEPTIVSESSESVGSISSEFSPTSQLSHDRELLPELKEVSDQWLRSKNEMTFSVGRFEKEYLNCAAVGIIRNQEQKIVGFVSMMPTYTNETISVDLIRWSISEEVAMMDALYLYSILWAKEQGYQKFNLGMAPFSSTYKNTINLENTFIYSVYNNTQYLYSFKGLRKYKEKYKPQWAAKYLVYENKTWVLKNLYACYKLIHSK